MITSSRAASGFAYAMLSYTVPENRKVSCSNHADLRNAATPAIYRGGRARPIFYAAIVNVIQAHHKIDQRRFADARFAHYSDELSGLYVEADVPQHVLGVVVTEGDVVYAEIALDFQIDGVLLVGDVDFFRR